MANHKEQYLHIAPHILRDSRLDPTKKILLSYILPLSKTDKGCYAGNETFGELLNINPDGASKQISKLKRLGYIETKRLYKNFKEYRYIKVLNLSNDKNNKQSEIFINIPYSVLFDINLSSTQKLLLSEIIALLKLPDGCYKSNNDFGELIGIGGSGISKQIKKLVEMNYITTEDIKIGNVTDHRKIELGTSFMTKEVLPKSQGGTSCKTNELLPKSQEGTSSGNTINTTIISKEIVPVLTQFTITEKIVEKSEIQILEQKIINSCSQGQELLNQFQNYCIDNIWMFVKTKQEIEEIHQLYKEYKAATKNLELNIPSTKT
jgi:DNA-binding MarR family transcriptional regulator